MEISSKDLSLNEKLKILADAAKYDVACTSSGSSRRGKKGMLGNTEAAGICHSFSSDGRCVSLLKILLSNECIYDCKSVSYTHLDVYKRQIHDNHIFWRKFIIIHTTWFNNK